MNKLPDEIINKLELTIDGHTGISFLLGCIIYNLDLPGFQRSYVTNYNPLTETKISDGEWLFIMRYRDELEKLYVSYVTISIEFLQDCSKEEIIELIKSHIND